MMSSQHNKLPTTAILAITSFTIFTLSLIELCRPFGAFHVVKLRYSLAHIHHTIHHQSLKLLKILSLTVPSVVILSLQKYSMQKRHGLCKNMRGNKKGQVPGTSKKVRREVKNGQVSGVELGVQRCPLERKKWTSVRQQNQGYLLPT